MTETPKTRFSHSRLGQTLILVGLLLTVTFLVQSRADDDLKTMNFQGRLVDAQGQPIAGTRTVLFKIKEDSTVIWQQQKAVSFKNGVFSVVLGDGNDPLTDRIGLPGVHVFSGDTTKAYALSLTIDGATFADIPIKRVPTATNAGFLEGKRADYFNPMSLKGDLIYLPSDNGDPASLGIGNEGQVLMVTANGLPSWQSLTTTENEIIVGDQSGLPTTTKVEDLIGSTVLLDDGDMLFRDESDGKVKALSVGGGNTILKSTGDTPQWANLATVLQDTLLSENGKILISDGSGNVVALGPPGAGQVLGEVNGVPAWVDASTLTPSIPSVERGIDIQWGGNSKVKLVPGGHDGKAVVNVGPVSGELIPVTLSSELEADFANGGLDTGDEEEDKGYYIYLATHLNGSNPKLLLSRSPSSPTLTLPYTLYSRPLFFVFNDGNFHIVEFQAWGRNSSACTYSPMLILISNGSATTPATVDGSKYLPDDARSITVNTTFDNDSTYFNGGYLYDGDGRFVWFNVVFQATGRSAYVNWEGEIPIVNGTNNTIQYDWLTGNGPRKCTIRLRGWKRNIP